MIPKSLRDAVGLGPGEVSVTVVGAGLRIEPLATDNLVESHGLLLLADDGPALSTDEIDELRRADQR